jgi:hypothetical protein
MVPRRRRTAEGQAESAFLDETDTEAGERFPKHIIDALLGSRVVVVFPDQSYFYRPYCLW